MCLLQDQIIVWFSEGSLTETDVERLVVERAHRAGCRVETATDRGAIVRLFETDPALTEDAARRLDGLVLRPATIRAERAAVLHLRSIGRIKSSSFRESLEQVVGQPVIVRRKGRAQKSCVAFSTEAGAATLLELCEAHVLSYTGQFLEVSLGKEFALFVIRNTSASRPQAVKIKEPHQRLVVVERCSCDADDVKRVIPGGCMDELDEWEVASELPALGFHVFKVKPEYLDRLDTPAVFTPVGIVHGHIPGGPDGGGGFLSTEPDEDDDEWNYRDGKCKWQEGVTTKVRPTASPSPPQGTERTSRWPRPS